MNNRTLTIVIAGIVVVLALAFFMMGSNTPATAPATPDTPTTPATPRALVIDLTTNESQAR